MVEKMSRILYKGYSIYKKENKVYSYKIYFILPIYLMKI